MGYTVAELRLVYKNEAKNCFLRSGPGPDDVSQKKLKPTPNMTSPKKNSNPKLTIFLVETTRLSESFEGLNSSLVQFAGELWRLAKMSKYTFRGILFFTKYV